MEETQETVRWAKTHQYFATIIGNFESIHSFGTNSLKYDLSIYF